MSTTELPTPTFTTDEIEVIAHAAYSAFMAGWSYNSSMGKVKEIYADDPSLHDEFGRGEFIAVAARAIRGFYNLPYDQSEFSDVVRYVATVYGMR